MDTTVVEEQTHNSLTPWRFRPGQSGNPGGRPKGRSLTAILRSKLATVDVDGLTDADRIASVLISMALSGDLRAIAMILDRTEGRVSDAVDEPVETQRPRIVIAGTVRPRADGPSPCELLANGDN